MNYRVCLEVERPEEWAALARRNFHFRSSSASSLFGTASKPRTRSAVLAMESGGGLFFMWFSHE